MSVNSSSTSSDGPSVQCANIRVSVYMYDTIAALKVLLLLPLSTFVLYLGHQRWRQQRSSKTATHSDVFTYHLAAMEMIGFLGIVCYFSGRYADNLILLQVATYANVVPLYGEIFFNVLTCVERYLAVVHPITYMGLKNARGVRIRNICIGCVWLLSFGINFAGLLLSEATSIVWLCLTVFFIIVISFCSLSVLCVLIRPGPGEGGREKKHVDQSKQRAFYTITVISVTVWLWFVGFTVATAIRMSPQLIESVRCLVTVIIFWFNLPSILVSPLLYLHRAGILSCCRRNAE